MATKINRYYNPARGQYLQQFVPQNLPSDLMIKALANKQQKYDEAANKIGALKDWTINALPGYDTKFRDQYKEELYNWADQMMTKDLSLPQYAQEYISKVRQVKDDKSLQTIEGAYATHQKALENIEKLKTGTPTDWDEAMAYDYQQRYGIYTGEQGEGFTGQIKLGDPNILKGTDIQADLEKSFDDIKGSGSEWTNYVDVEGFSVAYKQGFEGVGDERIQDQLKNVSNIVLDSRAGEQLGKRFDMEQGIWSEPYNQLSKEEKQKYTKERNAYVLNTALGVGREFIWGKSTTNKDIALRKGQDLGIAAMKDNPQVDPLFINTEPYKTNPTYETSLTQFQNGQTAINDQNQRLKTLDIVAQLGSGEMNINDPRIIWAKGNDKFKQMVTSLPYGNKILSGEALTDSEKLVFNSNLQRQVDSSKNIIGTAELNMKNFQDREIFALEQVTGKTQTSNGINYKDALGYEQLINNKYSALSMNTLREIASPETGNSAAFSFIPQEDKKRIKAYVETKDAMNKAKATSTLGLPNQFKDAFEKGSTSEVIHLKPTNNKYLQTHIVNTDGTVTKHLTPKATESVFGQLQTSFNADPASFIAKYGAQSNGVDLLPKDVIGGEYEMIGTAVAPVNGRVMVTFKRTTPKTDILGFETKSTKDEVINTFIPLETEIGNGIINYHYSNAMKSPESASGKASLDIVHNFQIGGEATDLIFKATKMANGETTSNSYTFKDANNKIHQGVIEIEKSRDATNATPIKYTITLDGEQINGVSNITDLRLLFEK